MKEIFSIIPYGERKKLIKLFNPSEAKLYFYDFCIDLIRGEKSVDTVFDYIKKLDDLSISEAAKEYENPGVVIEVDDEHRQVVYTVLWADNRITREHAGYLQGVQDESR